ncbi:hypothetical protein GOODEAATRI_010501 [Goodea atripinnis]|uniref:FIP-RBD domain-containing protein n=1 Tax=Goodea atripinnis TaxID=208336 RepID=A0ABV0NJE6_9TELE
MPSVRLIFSRLIGEKMVIITLPVHGHFQAFESVANYSNLTFEEVVQELIKQKEVVKKKDAHIRELEDYIDNLLVRVMEETPSILRTPYEPKKKKAGKLSKK